MFCVVKVILSVIDRSKGFICPYLSRLLHWLWDSRVICEIDQRKATTNQNQTLTVCMHFSVMYVSCRGPVRFTCSDPVACRHHLSGAHLRISQVLNYI